MISKGKRKKIKRRKKEGDREIRKQGSKGGGRTRGEERQAIQERSEAGRKDLGEQGGEQSEEEVSEADRQEGRKNPACNHRHLIYSAV